MSKAAVRWVVLLTGVGSLMAALDTLVVSTALSQIRLDLGASVEQLEWTVNAYNLSFAVLLITGAALGDRFGRRRLFAAGLGIFSVASAAGALSPDIGVLIAARALQGVGSALIMPLGLALLSGAFPPEKRGAAIGVFGGITGLAVAAGPLVGGAVVEGIDWHWIFWINVPIGLLSIPFVLTKMGESKGPETSVDVRGLGLITAGALATVWGLVRGNQAGWGSVEVIASLLVGAALLVGFLAWERRAEEPMLPPGLFRIRSIAAGNTAMFFIFASLFGAVFFYAQLMQTGLGYGPLEAGLRLLPWTGMFMVVAPITGAISDRVGERPLLVVGLLLHGAGIVWLAAIAKAGLPYSEALPPLLLGGVGISMAIPAAQNSVVSGVSEEELGKVAGANSLMRELGGVFGIALAVAVFAGSGGYASAADFVDGFTPAMFVCAGLVLPGLAAALALPGRRRAPGLVPVPALSQEV